jgi:DNA-binding NtrC family response regulator
VHFRVRLPALRERREDIPALVRQFVKLRASSCGHEAQTPHVHADLISALRRGEWPYNLRQLDGVVQRLLMEASRQGTQELSLAQCVGELEYLRRDDVPRKRPSPQNIRDRMRELGSATNTARSLGISRWTVYRSLEGGTPSADDPAE